MRYSLLFIYLFIVSCSFISQPNDVHDVDPKKLGTSIPKFKEVMFPFKHNFEEGSGFEFLGAALIDANNDGIDEVFVAGGQGQDKLFQFKDGNFKIINDKDFTSSEVSYGVLSIDYNHDGKTDLIICRNDGVYLFLNQGNFKFKEEKLDFNFGKDTTAIAVTAGDVNQDGYFDFYFSTFISASKFKKATFNEKGHGKPNKLFVSKFDNNKLTYIDQTSASGTAIDQNTFLSSFVDFDNDGDLDIVAALNTGRPAVFRNDNKEKFTLLPRLSEHGFWMGLAICDFSGNGYQDIFMSNAGNTIPKRFVRGDLTDDQKVDVEWLLSEYDDAKKSFVNRSKDKGLNSLEFAWGAGCADVNRDSTNDLVVMENYRGWFVHKWSKAPGRFLLNHEEKFHSATSIANVENYHFGLIPLISDFNNDGYYDMVYINVLSEAKAFINQGPVTKPDYVKIIFPETAEFVGAKAKLKTSKNRILNFQVTNGQGFMSDQTNSWIVGLDKSEKVENVEIKLINNRKINIQSIENNKTLFVSSDSK